MTRISPSLYPTPAGHTKAATHGTKASSCRDQFGAVTSVKGNQCAPEATPRPQRVKGPFCSWAVNTSDRSEKDDVTRERDARCAGSSGRLHEKDRYYSSETRRLCSGIESPRHGPINRTGHTIPQAFERLNAPQMRRDRAQGWLDMDMVKILVLSVLCLSVLWIVDAKRNHDLQVNWERINED